MEGTWSHLRDTIVGYLPSLGGALLILIVGWLVALSVSAGVRAALKRTRLDNKIAGWITGKERPEREGSERWISKIIYYLLMVFVLVAFFQTLGLVLVTQPLNEMLGSILEYLPRIISAAALLLLAWIVASLVRVIVTKLLRGSGIDNALRSRLGDDDTSRETHVAETAGNALYWLILLLFLPLILNTLSLEGLVSPLQQMLGGFLGFLPNVFGAGLILLIGWFAARIVQRVVTNVLAATGIDRAGERTGLDTVMGKNTLSTLVGLIAYLLILIPTILAALDALKLSQLSNVAGGMLSMILNAIPAVFTAALILLIAYIVGRLLSKLVSEILARIGFNTILDRLGLTRGGGTDQRTPSEIVGYLVLVGTIFFASIEAARLLGFAALASLLVQFIQFAGRVVLGIIIFGVGLYLANLAAGVIRSGKPGPTGFLATAAKVAIILLAAAMSLRQMGLADEIINTAFTLLLGAVAVAAALAFGLGSRDIAGHELNKWLQSVRGPGSSGS